MSAPGRPNIRWRGHEGRLRVETPHSGNRGRRSGIGAKLPNAEPRAAGAGRDPTATRNSARVSSARSAGALAVHQRDYVSGEPLQALDALRNGLAATIEDQLVHADRREISNVAGDVFRLAGEGPAGPVR
jgi:hypothetical protein